MPKHYEKKDLSKPIMKALKARVAEIERTSKKVLKHGSGSLTLEDFRAMDKVMSPQKDKLKEKIINKMRLKKIKNEKS